MVPKAVFLFLSAAALLSLHSKTVAAAFEKPLIIAHRGSPCNFPESTVEGYRKAIQDGVDFIELDVVSTLDGELVVLHDIILDDSTDVASYPQFQPRRRVKVLPDGSSLPGWFVSDFTLAEVKGLTVKQRLDFRDHANDGKFRIPTLGEVLQLANATFVAGANRSVGVYVETKQPAYHVESKLPLEEKLLTGLADAGLLQRGGNAVILQSFENKSLEEMGNNMVARGLPLAPLVWLLDCQADLPTRAELAAFAKYGAGIGPQKEMLAPLEFTAECKRPATVVSCEEVPTQVCAGRLVNRTTLGNDTLLDRARELKLFVHVYTFANEEHYMAVDFKADPGAEMDYFAGQRGLGVQGIFSDCPSTASNWRTRVMAAVEKANPGPKVGGGGGQSQRARDLSIIFGTLVAVGAVLGLVAAWKRRCKFSRRSQGYENFPATASVGSGSLERQDTNGSGLSGAPRDTELAFSTFQMVSIDTPRGGGEHRNGTSQPGAL